MKVFEKSRTAKIDEAMENLNMEVRSMVREAMQKGRIALINRNIDGNLIIDLFNEVLEILKKRGQLQPDPEFCSVDAHIASINSLLNEVRATRKKADDILKACPKAI